MLQCTLLTRTAFPSAMDLQQQGGMKCEDSCVHAVVAHNGSSSASRSPSLSPQIEEDDDIETVGGELHQGNVVKQWSYEEQFRQLYNLSPEQERKDFLDKLFNYMQKKGTPITRIPIMAKQPLDMYKLFRLVVERGGLVEVIKKKAWRDIAKELNLPASITSAAFTMRSQYVKYLYPYECEEEKLSDPKELQLAIDSNKRDRRHSDSVDFLPTCRETERREQIIGQPTYAVTGTPSGLQLISSPTVATMPPYSGGFILTPTGAAHVVHTSRISPGGPQLVQMAANHPHVPIVVPTSIPGSPLATMIPVSNSSALMMGKKSDERTAVQESSSVHHSIVFPPTIQAPGLVHVKPNESLTPITITQDRRGEDIVISEREQEEEQPPPAKRLAIESSSDSSTSSGTSNQGLGMPFTNISIKPAYGGVGNMESSPSVLVTLELNNTIYQGVLFARPHTSNSPTR